MTTGTTALKSSFSAVNAAFQQIDEDNQRVSEIIQLLKTGAISESLSNEDKAKALMLFKQIQLPLEKMNAFAAVISEGHTDDADLAKQCYEALSNDLQEEFRQQLWEANNCADNGHGDKFGQHVIDTGLTNNQLAERAVQAVRNKLMLF